MRVCNKIFYGTCLAHVLGFTCVALFNAFITVRQKCLFRQNYFWPGRTPAAEECDATKSSHDYSSLVHKKTR